MRSRAAVANTTGVSSTTVASRLSTAVTAAATANTSTSSRRGSPRAPPAISAPSAVNRPVAPAAVGEHEQRGEEADGRRQVAQRVAGVVRAHGARPRRAAPRRRPRRPTPAAGAAARPPPRARRPGPEGERQREPVGHDPIMPAREDARMHRPPPELMQRLPAQYFAGILAAVAAERARPGPRVIDLGRGNPDLPPPPHALAARAGGHRRPGTARLRAVPGRARAARGDRGALRGRPRRGPRPRARGRGGTRRQDGDHAARARLRAGAATRSRCPTPATRTTCRRSPSPAPAAAAAAHAGHAGSPTGTPWPAPTRRCWWSTTPRTRRRCARAPGTFEAAVAFARERGAWLASDLAYGFLTFDGPPRAQRPRGRRRPRVRRGAVVGLEDLRDGRLADGFLVGNAELVGRVRALVDHVAAGVSMPLQRGLRRR